jgi:hypothetical protein
MIEAEVKYLIKDKDSFEKKVVPYIFGGGFFYDYKTEYNLKKSDAQLIAEVKFKAETLSQLIVSLTGMLRYSKDCYLNKIKIEKNTGKSKIIFNPTDDKKIIFGIILKPSLNFQSEIISQLLKYSKKYNLDFVKDDDASDYSIEEIKEIIKLSEKIPYFQKVSSAKKSFSNYAMIVPWVDGWNLLQHSSEDGITMSHCASLSPQVSWEAHITFSRLAGAYFVIVPDFKFDDTFSLEECLEVATAEIENTRKVKLIISGGITPNRINELLKLVNKKFYNYIGFAVGSWVLSSNNIEENFISLKNIKDGLLR